MWQLILLIKSQLIWRNMMPSLLKLSFKLLSMMTNLPTHLVMLVNLNGGFGILNVCIHYTLPCFILFPEKIKNFFFYLIDVSSG